MRRAVFHFHLFKNAGSSIDRILQDTFPGQWAEREFRFTKKSWPYEEIATWISETPNVQAYSSHTARLPLPDLPNIELLPIIFIRHPLIRLYSGYKYELDQDADTPGARKAKDVDFNGYVEWRLQRPHDASAKNFQSNRLSHLIRPERGKLTEAEDMEALALQAIELLPFIGFVEKFDMSMQALSRILARWDVDLKISDARENVNSDLSQSTEERLKQIQNELSGTVLEKYNKQNSADLKIYEIVKNWYGG